MFGILWFVSYSLVVIGLSAYGLHRFWMVYTYYKHKHKKVNPLSRFTELPTVTVQLPIFNELYVVERLIRSVVELDYPKHLLEIQVLDDSTDETKELAQRVIKEYQALGFQVEHLHRVDRQGFKAGALQAGMKKAKGEFILIFDADFLPPPSIIEQTLHYFTDPNVGMIQTRWGHINRSSNFLTKVQALLLDGHLMIEQTARNRSGRFFNFNGTAGIWRKTCIEDAGGWQHDTLTEDLDLSYRAQIKGWRFIFVPDVITPAELPMEMNAFKAQQHRWAKGAIQTCKKILPRVWESSLPLKIKLEATFHLTSNFAYLLLALLAILIQPNPNYAGFQWKSIMIVDIPIFMMASFSIFVFYGVVLRELKYPWYKVFIYVPMLIATGIGLCLNNAKAVLEALFNHHTDFARTPKYGAGTAADKWWKQKYKSAHSFLPWLELAMAGYYLYLVHFAWQNKLWVSLPFFALFVIGFGFAGFYSLFQRSALSPWLGRLKGLGT
ncbi:MAG: glycosyltransferase family 2 protein [Blastochloris sp.]|nr:glycosyltransferase family 2 protein [Blastochloris sp.]